MDFLDEVRDTPGVPACLQVPRMSTQRLELHALYCTRAAYNKAGGSDAAVWCVRSPTAGLTCLVCVRVCVCVCVRVAACVCVWLRVFVAQLPGTPADAINSADVPSTLEAAASADVGDDAEGLTEDEITVKLVCRAALARDQARSSCLMNTSMDCVLLRPTRRNWNPHCAGC